MVVVSTAASNDRVSGLKRRVIAVEVERDRITPRLHISGAIHGLTTAISACRRDLRDSKRHICPARLCQSAAKLIVSPKTSRFPS